MAADATPNTKIDIQPLFAFWVPHAMRPYFGNGTRISIAINLR